MGSSIRSPSGSSLACLAMLWIVPALSCGCSGVREYVANGLKVGPNYATPPAQVTQNWIDAGDERVRSECDDLSQWWTVFNDPVLNSLICCAYHQNLTLRQAGFRVLQARSQLNIDRGNLFPQAQYASGDFTRKAISQATANVFPNAHTSQWDFAFNLNWELDFWGRFRRALEADCANLDASVANYDDVLVTLLGDIATNYAQLRTFQQRIKYATDNVQVQRETLAIVEARFRAGTTNEVDMLQARSTLEQTEADVPELQIGLRQANNRLCILLGMPPAELAERLGPGQIPTAPPEVAVGIPADLLRRRPDVRRAERQAAAQSALIGVAQAAFYPALAINGTLGYSAAHFPDLFQPKAFMGNVGPSFHWDLLNYGRILNNVCLQDARFQELVAAYQHTVLTAAEDVENGLVTFLRAQQRTRLQQASVDDAEKAVRIALAQYRAGTIDFTQVTQLEQALVLQQDTLARARNEIASGLIQVYRALGGGWELRSTDCPPTDLPPQGTAPPEGTSPPPAEPLPAPHAEPGLEEGARNLP